MPLTNDEIDRLFPPRDFGPPRNDQINRALKANGGGGAGVAIAIIGQSNERGQVDPTEAIGGALSRTVHPLAFGSLLLQSMRYPIYPAVAYSGGALFAMHDAIAGAGHSAAVLNTAVGGMSMIRDGCGQTQIRANNTSYRQRRPSEGYGDHGYAGDVTVVQGKVALCTRGVLAYAMSATNGIPIGGATTLDYIRTVGTQVTAGAEPAAFATAAVGDVVVDGGIEWTIMSTTTTWNGAVYTAGNMLTVSRYGFDPFNICARALQEVKAVPLARRRIVMLQNAQSDASTANILYEQALTNIGNYLLQNGVAVSVGLSCYSPTITTANYDALTTRVNNALNTLRTAAGAGVYYKVSDVVTGANLYSVMGSNGPMAAGGAYFLKDAGQDNIHLNAPGAIVAGGHMAQPVVAWLDSFTT